MKTNLDLMNELMKQNIELERQVTMAPYTSFRIGGRCPLIALPRTPQQLCQCVAAAQRHGVPYRIFGQASNILYPSSGSHSFVILLRSNFAAVRREGDVLCALAGATVRRLCNEALEAGLSGLEPIYGIPGSIGGGLHNNCGAFHRELSDLLVRCTVLHQGRIEEWQRSDLQFSYRQSPFDDQDAIVLEAAFQLEPGEPEAVRSRMQDILERRQTRQPLNYPSAGSVFKRPAGHYASALIDQCGLKGRRVGDAQVSLKHAGFIVNLGAATSEDVSGLIAEVQKEVWDQTSVKLECEVEMIDS